MIVERLKTTEVSFDPNNARKHTRESLDAVKQSLKRFGQQKPIVVDSENVVRAGNATFAAAVELGFVEIDCVRTMLNGTDATAYAIADNRTGDLSAWNDEILFAQIETLFHDDQLDGVGFDENDLKALSDKLEVDKPEVDIEPEIFEIVVTCESADEQQRVFDDLTQRGRRCRIVRV